MITTFKNRVDELYSSIFLEIQDYIHNEYSVDINKNPKMFHKEISRPDLVSDIDKALFQIKQGSIKPIDVYSLEKLIDIPINNYLEIGSYLGVGFRVINELFHPKFSVSIDPNIHHRIFTKPRNVFHKLNKKFADKYKTIDSFWINGDPSINASYFGDTKFDLIFIDGDHSYESVKNDFNECYKLLSQNGIILLHDVYSWKDVGRFAVELESRNDIVVRWSNDDEYIDGFCAVTFAS